MKTAALILSTMVAFLGLAPAPAADPDDGSHAHGAAARASCETVVHLTEEAERQPGGALYGGPLPDHHARRAESMPEMVEQSLRSRGKNVLVVRPHL